MDILEFMTDVIARLGYVGIALLMLLENVIPPIPSEIIMPLAGFAVARGEMTMVGAIASGTIGTLLGATVWFYVGRIMSLSAICRLADRYGRWIGIASKDVIAVQRWFTNRGGYWSLALGRMLPSVRTYISVPAGVARVSLLPFLLYSTLGSLGWITLLTLAGYYLGDRYEQVSSYMGPIGKVVSVGLVAGFLGWLLYRWYQNRSQTST